MLRRPPRPTRTDTLFPHTTLFRSARPIIEIDGVSKTYRTQDGEVPSLKPLDFQINDGEFLVVVGPSGCGKSTLLKMIAGLLPPTDGEIRVDGKAITKPHSVVGVVFQSAQIGRASCRERVCQYV